MPRLPAPGSSLCPLQLGRGLLHAGDQSLPALGKAPELALSCPTARLRGRRPPPQDPVAAGEKGVTRTPALHPVVGGQGLPLVPAAAPSCDHPLPSSSSTRRPREPTPPPVSEPAKCWEEDLGRALAQALKEQGGWAGRHTFQDLSLLISKMRTVDDSPPRSLPALGEPHSRPINMFVCVSSQATH